MFCLTPFPGFSYLEDSKLGSHILFTQVQLCLPENDGQRPESKQRGHAEESVDPQSCALLRDLVADRKTVRKTKPQSLDHLPTGFSGLPLFLWPPRPVCCWCSEISSRTQR